MRVVLLRPPRFVWPFNSETSAFWQPLGLLCLAAAARAHIPEIEVEVIDAPARKCGWRTLQRVLAARRIDVLGIGEETVSAHEGLRAAALAKALHPECLVVAGGPYYAHALKETLADTNVDVVVRGEGEATFVELLRNAGNRSAWPKIEGIAFRDDDGSVHLTPPRRLIEDLDTLPFPAYDLLEMQSYGRGSRNHPALVSVEHSRGCIDRCAFCILWKQMGEPRGRSADVRPRYRTQSAERSFDNVLRLYREFGRRTFGWVDPTFNVSPLWSDRWADLMLRSALMDTRGRPRTLHTAWMRADCVVRDQKRGVLEKLVRAGVRQVMIGVERDDAPGLAALDKHHNGADICREAFAIFHERYPEVFTIGTAIYGLPGDTADDLERLAALDYDMQMDYCFLAPLTPNPGTRAAEEAKRAGRVAGSSLATYNFHTPVCETEALDLRRQESIYWRMMFRLDRRRLARAWQFLFRQRDRRKRRVYWALWLHGTRVALKTLARALRHPLSPLPALHSRKPRWYEQ